MDSNFPLVESKFSIHLDCLNSHKIFTFLLSKWFYFFNYSDLIIYTLILTNLSVHKDVVSSLKLIFHPDVNY